MANVSPEVAEAITRQKARYGRYADTKQWHLFAALGVPNARYSFLDNVGKPLMAGKQALVFDSPRAVADFFTRFFSSFDTLHNIGIGDFEPSTEATDEVSAVFGFEDEVISKTLGAWAEIRGGGFYHETWKLVDGEWRIQELRMERTYQKMTTLVWVVLTILGFLGISP